MGRRSPGRSGGRGPVGALGRGRWKMGWPGTGRPGVGRAAAPASALGAAGRIGALYTGRGPVCGTIMRGDGTGSRGGADGAAGLVPRGAAGCMPAGSAGAAGGAEAWAAGGGATGAAGRVGIGGPAGIV